MIKFLTAIFILLSTWLLIIITTSTSDIQPSTAIANQLPGHLVSTQIRNRGPNCFKFPHSIDNAHHKHCINR